MSRNDDETPAAGRVQELVEKYDARPVSSFKMFSAAKSVVSQAEDEGVLDGEGIEDVIRAVAQQKNMDVAALASEVFRHLMRTGKL